MLNESPEESPEKSPWYNITMFRPVMLAIIWNLLEEKLSSTCSHMEVKTSMIRSIIMCDEITGLGEADREVDKITKGREWIDVKELLNFSYPSRHFSCRGANDKEIAKTKKVLYDLYAVIRDLENHCERPTDCVVSPSPLPRFLDELIASSSLIEDLLKERLIIVYNDPMLGESFWAWNLNEKEKIEKIYDEGIMLSSSFSNALLVEIFRKMFIEIFPAPMPLNWNKVEEMIWVTGKKRA
ncbi:MAG: hypothetical protein WCQ96_04545 [Patescibacteria group bacterium]